MCIQTKNAPFFFAGKVLRCSKQWPGAIHLGEWNTSSIDNFLQGRCFERIPPLLTEILVLKSCDVPTIHPHSLLERFTALTLSSPVCLRGFCTSAPSNCTTEVSWDRVTPDVGTVFCGSGAFPGLFKKTLPPRWTGWLEPKPLERCNHVTSVKRSNLFFFAKTELMLLMNLNGHTLASLRNHA